jgi:hypothetical protein
MFLFNYLPSDNGRNEILFSISKTRTFKNVKLRIQLFRRDYGIIKGERIVFCRSCSEAVADIGCRKLPTIQNKLKRKVGAWMDVISSMTGPEIRKSVDSKRNTSGIKDSLIKLTPIKSTTCLVSSDWVFSGLYHLVMN